MHMDNGSGNPPATDQGQKGLSISLAASSMINASDMITAEEYQANAQRIQEVNEIARVLHFNNEAAHRNFLVDQLEKRAEEGRKAENMLAQLRKQPRLPATVQFNNDVPSDKSEDILPTTATLVEVPDSPLHSSFAPSTTSHQPQSVPQSRPANYHWSSPQNQAYYPDAFRYYVPPTTTHPSLQHSAALHTHAPVDTGHWYPTQNPPPRPRVHNPSAQRSSYPMQAQQPVRSWISYAPQFSVPSAAVPASGYYTSSGDGTAPTAPSSSSSNLTYRGPGVSTQSVTSQPPFITHNQPLNSTSRVPVPFQNVPAVPVKPFAQTPIGSHSKPTESQSRPVSTTASNQVVVSEFQRSRKLSEQLQQHEQQPQTQRLFAPPLQPQQQQSQPLQPPIQPQPRAQQFQQSPHPPRSHQQPPAPSANRVSPTSAPQPHTQSHQPQPVSVQEQLWQRGKQVDQATFIKHFHSAVQRGALQLQAFWFYAKASGISDEWFKTAINSLPRNVWNAVMTQANRSGAALDTTQSANASQQQALAVPNSNASVTNAALLPTAAPLSKMTSTAQQATEPSISSEGDSASKLYHESYAPQLQYYAEQATKSAHLAQTLGISTSSQGNIAPTQRTVTTPQRDGVPQVTANVRSPKDANKSTLARDVLHALGKIAPKPCQEMGGEPPDKADKHEGDKLPEVNLSQSTSRPAAAKPPVTLLEAAHVEANPPSISSANPDVQDVPQVVISPCQSIVKSVLKADPRQPVVDEGRIMIDLTLDEDESIDGKGQEPNFLMQTSTNAFISPQPVSPINTTNHTPRLENLSLEEPTVSLAGDSDSADMRMRSPPLVLGAEENTGSELVYPLPGRVEPVSQTFEPSPDERNEDQLDGQLPLFLPSPPASPAPTEPPVTDLEEDETRPPLKRHSVDVDKMEIDGETETPPLVRKRRKRQVYVLIPPAPLYVKRSKMKERVAAEGRDSDSEGVGQDEELQYSHLEQLLIEESKARLLERRCRWSNCGAILNSAANLLAHLRNHAREEASEAPFFCRWASCQRQFSMEQERDVHLERHTTKPLPCSFAGCDKQFDKPVEVMQHEVEHQKTDRREALVRKPTCQPIVPAIPARLGQPPHRLPSHRVIPRRVAKCQISADRHAIVGPWVLWNVFSPVDLNMRKQNASMRSRPTRQAMPTNCDMDSLDPRRDDYDFLLATSPSSAKVAPLDDIDSTAITMSAARGLTLWGREERTTAAESRNSIARQSHEEDSVERMLAD